MQRKMHKREQGFIGIIIVIIFVLLISSGLYLYLNFQTRKAPENSELPKTEQAQEVKNFEECAAKGYQILEVSPRQCKTPEGTTFTEEIQLEEPIIPPENKEEEPPEVTCNNECSTKGQMKCTGNGYQVCGNFDNDTCLEWGSVTNCSVNTICQNGACTQQKCSDGTLYGQCSTNKPKYCENGNLVDKCSLCGCIVNQSCQKNEDCVPLVDCEYKNYKMVFIVVEDSNNPATQEILSLLNEVKQKVSEMFTWATKNLASMDTSYPIVVLTLEGNPSVKDITEEFYKKHPDDFHFITIFSTHDYTPPEAGREEAGHFHLTLRNYIKGIGLGIFNSAGGYGSGGKLMGVNWISGLELTMKYRRELEQVIDIKTDIANGILHETTHQWSAYIDFIDENGKRSNSLRSPYGGWTHWTKKLETGYDYLGGFSWTDNGNGTFTAKPPSDRQGYSNLTLYLMGLISKSEVGPIKLIISDRDEAPIQPGDTIPGILKTISIQQIIAAEGERECVLP